MGTEQRKKLIRISPEEWRRLLAERSTPSEGRRIPSNIIARPLQGPPMERVKAD